MGYATLHFIHGFDAINTLYHAGYYAPTAAEKALFTRGVEVSILEMYDLMKKDAEQYASTFGGKSGCNESDSVYTNDCNQGNYRYKGYENALIAFEMVQKFGNPIPNLDARINELLAKYDLTNSSGVLDSFNRETALHATISELSQPIVTPDVPTPTPVPPETVTPTSEPEISEPPGNDLPDVTETPEPSVDPCPRKKEGDATCDGRVTLLDLEVWRREYFGESTLQKADFDGQENQEGNAVTLVDLQVLLDNIEE